MRRLAARLFSLFRRSRLEQELDDEVAAHLELAAADHRANGLSHEDARVAALRRFGGVTQTKEAFRDGRGFPALELAWRDLRFACRLLRRQPLFAAAAIVTVALGVGANTAVVSVLETVLLNPLGLRQADRVMAVRTQFVKLHLFHAETSGVEFREMQSLTEVFSAVAAMEGRAWTWLVNDEASRLVGQAVTPDFFRVFGEYPASGRFFTSEDNELSVVLSDGLWRTRFGADPSAVGRTMMARQETVPHRGRRSGGVSLSDAMRSSGRRSSLSPDVCSMRNVAATDRFRYSPAERTASPKRRQPNASSATSMG